MQSDDQVNIGAELRSLIARAQSLKNDPGVDKKWLNKITARLEEVETFTVRLYKPDSLNNPANMDSLAGQAPTCTCPPGVRDSQCPVHGGKI